MRKWILAGLLIICTIGAIIAYQAYTRIMSPNVPETLEHDLVYIPTSSSFHDVVQILFANNQIIDTVSFRQVADLMKYNKNVVKAGRYRISPAWSNRELISHLRSGNQEPVNLVFNYGWLVNDVAGAASQFIEADSAELIELFSDQEYIQAAGYTEETLMSLFIPNTYEVYWNTDAEGFFQRMVREHDRFWGANDRLAKAEQLGMTPTEVYTLASIVEREISKDSEKKRVAGLYLNRIKVGMKLDADPTAKFATRDFKATRILYKHTRFESPYNTYLHPGLPPGPISMASIKSIDAVLEAEDHNYYFMCVDTENLGYHLFAETIHEHNRNAAKYHRWMDEYEAQQRKRN